MHRLKSFVDSPLLKSIRTLQGSQDLNRSCNCSAAIEVCKVRIGGSIAVQRRGNLVLVVTASTCNYSPSNKIPQHTNLFDTLVFLQWLEPAILAFEPSYLHDGF